MPPTPAPAARALLAQATKRWPNRNRASDGIMSSDAHKKQNPRSGHDHGNAVDLTHDPANGCGAHEWADAILKRRDPRVLYVISRRRIWSVARYAEGWRPYTGSNPHVQHVHFEIDPTKRNDTSDWFNAAPPITSAPKVRPMFDPPFTISAPIVASAKDPLTDGVWVLSQDGAIYAFEGARGVRGCNGQPWWGDRKAAKIGPAVEPGKIVVVTATTSETYHLPVVTPG